MAAVQRKLSDFGHAVGKNNRCDQSGLVCIVIAEHRHNALYTVGHDDLGRVTVVPDEDAVENGERAVPLVQPAQKGRAGKGGHADVPTGFGYSDFLQRFALLKGLRFNPLDRLGHRDDLQTRA